MEKIRPIHIQEFQQFLVQECFVTNKEGKIRPLSNNYIKQILISYGLFLNVRWFWKSLMRIQ